MADPLADTRTQAEFAGSGVTMPEVAGDPPSSDDCGAASWDTVNRELVMFPDPAGGLPPIDRLEGFRPDGHGLYQRALVPVSVGEHA